jgi:hypothetical protein
MKRIDDNVSVRLAIIATASLIISWFITGTTLFIDGEVLMGLASFILPPATLYTSFLVGGVLGIIHTVSLVVIVFIISLEVAKEKRLPQRNPYYNSIV